MTKQKFIFYPYKIKQRIYFNLAVNNKFVVKTGKIIKIMSKTFKIEYQKNMFMTILIRNTYTTKLAAIEDSIRLIENQFLELEKERDKLNNKLVSMLNMQERENKRLNLVYLKIQKKFKS